MLFDSHAHYDNKRFDEDRFEVIKRPMTAAFPTF